MKTKFIFITGGVVSSLGKGLASASLGALLQSRGMKVRLRKMDPYLNVDPGTMSPIQHGEVFVTQDGAETDLDLGHYERFTNVDAKRSDNVTAGQIYSKLISKERKGDYLGGTVQVIPHVTDLIKQFIISNLDDEDFVLCEIGGTVGDIEALPFFESIRQIGYELGRDKCLFIHLTLVPYISAAGELKTKPTQHSVKELRSIGITPDILLCRADREIPITERRKIGLFCNIEENNVIQALDVESIYQVPVKYHMEGLDSQVLKHFNLNKAPKPELKSWQNIAMRYESPSKGEVNIAVVGKYTSLNDAYKSLTESLDHAGIASNVRVNIKWVNSRIFEQQDNVISELKNTDAILVPGGFGERGVRGKLLAANYARTNKIPYFGICFGMQIAVIEYARNMLGLKTATSSEFGALTDDERGSLVGLMTEWQRNGMLEVRGRNDDLGGTMRLGSYPCKIAKDTLAHKIYGNTKINERHRHRYEVNFAYVADLEKAGLTFSGFSPNGQLPEIIEIKDHPFFIAVQFHPEFKSRPSNPHPIFKAFIDAAVKYKKTAKSE